MRQLEPGYYWCWYTLKEKPEFEICEIVDYGRQVVVLFPGCEEVFYEMDNYKFYGPLQVPPEATEQGVSIS
jgi:hypothetical protein